MDDEKLRAEILGAFQSQADLEAIEDQIRDLTRVRDMARESHSRNIAALAPYLSQGKCVVMSGDVIRIVPSNGILCGTRIERVPTVHIGAPAVAVTSPPTQPVPPKPPIGSPVVMQMKPAVSKPTSPASPAPPAAKPQPGGK